MYLVRLCILPTNMPTLPLCTQVIPIKSSFFTYTRHILPGFYIFPVQITVLAQFKLIIDGVIYQYMYQHGRRVTNIIVWAWNKRTSTLYHYLHEIKLRYRKMPIICTVSYSFSTWIQAHTLCHPWCHEIRSFLCFSFSAIARRLKSACIVFKLTIQFTEVCVIKSIHMVAKT